MNKLAIGRAELEYPPPVLPCLLKLGITVTLLEHPTRQAHLLLQLVRVHFTPAHGHRVHPVLTGQEVN